MLQEEIVFWYFSSEDICKRPPRGVKDCPGAGLAAHFQACVVPRLPPRGSCRAPARLRGDEEGHNDRAVIRWLFHPLSVTSVRTGASSPVGGALVRRSIGTLPGVQKSDTYRLTQKLPLFQSRKGGVQITYCILGLRHPPPSARPARWGG